MAGDAGVPFTEIPAMVLNLARERGWLPREEAAKLRAELAAAERDRDEARAIAAEGRAAGRAEAAAILMNQEADSFPGDDLAESCAIGDTGDYSAEWVPEKVRALFDVPPNGGAVASLLERLDGAYWEAVARKDDAENARAAAEREVERLRKYEPRLLELHADGKGANVAITAPQLVELFSSVWADWFKETGAENYVECRVHHNDGREFVFHLQLAGRKTPHEFRKEAEAESDRRGAVLALYRAKYAVDGRNGRPWDATVHLEAVQALDAAGETPVRVSGPTTAAALRALIAEAARTLAPKGATP
jgi:hypothetical protein